MLCCAVLCCDVLRCAVLCCVVLCCVVICCAVLCRVVVCCVVLFCVTLMINYGCGTLFYDLAISIRTGLRNAHLFAGWHSAKPGSHWQV